MSKNKKKYKGQKQRSNVPWLIVALGGAVLLGAAFLLASRNHGTPSISVDQQKIDFGTQKFGTPLTFAIKVSNTGDSALRFQEQPYIEVLEGC